MNGKKILIVDDDPHIRRTLKIRLRAHSYETVQAADGYSAIAAATRERPGLIILDLGLPEGDGFSVLQNLREIEHLAEIPVIVLSARHPQMNEKRSLQAGARAFFQKPVDNHVLMDCIRDALPQPFRAQSRITKAPSIPGC